MPNNQNGLIHLIVIIVIAGIIGSFLISGVANNAKPGDSFYSIDKFFEKVKLLTSIGNENKIKTYSNISDERQNELLSLVDEGAEQSLIDQVVDDYLHIQEELINQIGQSASEAKDELISDISAEMSAQIKELESVASKAGSNYQSDLERLVNNSKQNFNQLTKDLSAKQLEQIEETAKTQVRNIGDLLQKAGL